VYYTATTLPLKRFNKRTRGEKIVSLNHLMQASAAGDDSALLRYVRLHLGDGNEAVGRAEIDKAWVVALKALLPDPPTDYAFIRKLVAERDRATLAHLFFYLHFALVAASEAWIHDGTL